MNRVVRLAGVSACALAVWCTASQNALAVDWDDGGFGTNWSNQFNWNPTGIPLAGDDVFIGNLAAAAGDQTVIDQDFVINNLTISNSASADTDGNFLDMNGDLSLSGTSGGVFIASEHNSGAGTTSLDVENVTVSGLSQFRLEGGRVIVAVPGGGNGSAAVIEIQSAGGTDGDLTGWGTLRFQDGGLTSPIDQINNNGLISTARPAGAPANDRFTLTIESGDNTGNAQIDLDGSFDTSDIVVDSNTTLDIDMPIRGGTFFGSIDMRSGAILDLEDDIAFERMFLFNQAVAVTAGSSTATVRANSVSIDDDYRFNVNTGTLVIDAPFTQLGGQINLTGNDTGIQFEETATLNGNIAFTGINTFINARGDLEFDQSGGYTLQDTLNFLPAGTSPFLRSTDGLTVDDGQINLLGTTVRVATNVTFQNGASTDVASGAEIRFFQGGSFMGGTSHTGDGIFKPAEGSYTIDGATTIDMPGGEVDLDGNENPGVGTQIGLNSNLTINAGMLGPTNRFGTSSGTNVDLLTINNGTARLTVNLTNPAEEWTLGSNASMIIVGSAGTIAEQLDGSDLNIEGTLTVSNSTRFGARIDVEAGGLITLSSATGELQLMGGTEFDPNRMRGGTIGGNGEISTFGLNDSWLVGFGTIDVDVDFAGGSDLFADDGVLTINGTVLGADVIGTADSDATLSLGANLNTANVTALELNGGEVTGGFNIFNNTITRGGGTISTQFFRNNATLAATIFGVPLVIDTVGNPNLDGTGAENGVVEAILGDIVVVNPLNDAFNGTITVAAAQSITFQSNWTLAGTGVLNLNGAENFTNAAAVEGPGLSSLQGTINVDRSGSFSHDAVFTSAVTVNLPAISEDQLLLKGNTTVQPGATFTGFGSLVNGDTGTLTLLDGADLGASVTVINDGVLEIGSSPGTASVARIAFGSTSNWIVEIGGTNSDDFDWIISLSDVALGGTLDLRLINGFVPQAGDAFQIISAFANITGTFSNELLPTLAGGLTWDTSDITDNGIISVVSALIPGDADGDGDVDLADFNILAANFGLGPGAPGGFSIGDFDEDTDVDLQDFNILAANFGIGTESVGALPEPGVAVLMLVSLSAVAARRRR